MVQLLLTDGSRALNSSWSLGQNNLEAAEFIQGDNNTAGANSSEFIRLNNSGDTVTLNASSTVELNISGTTKLDVGPGKTDILTDGLDLNGNDIVNIGDVELDSLTKDGTGTINVNDTFNILNNVQMNNNQINMQDSGSGRIINLHNPSGETDDRAATKGYVDNAVSDPSLKENMSALSGGLAAVNQMKPVEFEWRVGANQGEPRLGLDAESIQNAHPQATATKDLQINGEEHPDTLTYHKQSVVALLVSAVQELSSRIEDLENA